VCALMHDGSDLTELDRQRVAIMTWPSQGRHVT